MNLPKQAAARSELRQALGPAAKHLNDVQASKLLSVTGWDADLAATALQMNPRPKWVQAIAGQLSPPGGS